MIEVGPPSTQPLDRVCERRSIGGPFILAILFLSCRGGCEGIPDDTGVVAEVLGRSEHSGHPETFAQLEDDRDVTVCATANVGDCVERWGAQCWGLCE